MAPETIPELLSARVRETPGAPAFLTLSKSGAWQAVSWSTFAAEAERLARALHRSGAGRATRVAILARTSLDWERAQTAALSISATVIGIDPNYPDDTLAHVLDSTAPEVLFVEDDASVARVPPAARAGLRRLIALRGTGEGGAMSLATFLLGAEERGALPPRPGPDDDAIVAFSSGTTGPPKPIVYTHRQVQLAVTAIVRAFPDIGPGSRLACWLPLANLFQRIINFCAIARGASSYMVEDPREIVTRLGTINPHVFVGVPRFFEKLQSGIVARLSSGSRRARRAAELAVACGQHRTSGATGSLFERARFALADRLVLRRLRGVFGTDVRYLISGSAPMPLWLLEWFEAIGLPVLEAYGVSENIVPVAMNRPGARRLGTVGQPTLENEVRLATDGEVLVRGPGVFRGYLGVDGGPRPDAEGFWATGDLGEFTADGFLRLTGRKTEAFKTAAGRWVVPAHIEATLGRLPYVEHAVVIRSGANRVVAILNVDLARLRGRDGATGDAPDDGERERVARDAAIAVAGLPTYLRPAGLLIATAPFSIAGGELTSNLKLRRAAVAERFRPQLDRLTALLVADAEPAHDMPATPVVLTA